jgi:hypothetical protein
MLLTVAWLPVLGCALRKALLRNLGDPPSLPFPKGSHGETESHANHCHCLVHPPCINLLIAVGEDRSFHITYSESCFTGAMRCKLLVEL